MSLFASLISVSMTSRSALIVSVCSISARSSVTTGAFARLAIELPLGRERSISAYVTTITTIFNNNKLRGFCEVLELTSDFESCSSACLCSANFCWTILSAETALLRMVRYLDASSRRGGVKDVEGVRVQRSLNCCLSCSSDFCSSFNDDSAYK